MSILASYFLFGILRGAAKKYKFEWSHLCNTLDITRIIKKLLFMPYAICVNECQLLRDLFIEISTPIGQMGC
jgi:hypothetical protein